MGRWYDLGNSSSSPNALEFAAEDQPDASGGTQDGGFSGRTTDIAAVCFLRFPLPCIDSMRRVGHCEGVDPLEPDMELDDKF